MNILKCMHKLHLYFHWHVTAINISTDNIDDAGTDDTTDTLDDATTDAYAVLVKLLLMHMQY